VVVKEHSFPLIRSIPMYDKVYCSDQTPHNQSYTHLLLWSEKNLINGNEELLRKKKTPVGILQTVSSEHFCPLIKLDVHKNLHHGFREL